MAGALASVGDRGEHDVPTPRQRRDAEATVAARYEWSRGVSPFNQTLYATRNAPDAVHTWAVGTVVTLDATVPTHGCRGCGPCRLLQATFGYSASIIERLPPDTS